MMEDTAKIRADFDRIALLPPGKDWNHNSHYHDFLLRQLPARCGDALEIGCGQGEFARLLSSRADRVLALDLSPQMIRVAAEQSARYPNIRYECADVIAWESPPESFDCIVSIATLHHMPLEAALVRMKTWLKPGGVLLILDLYRVGSIADLLRSIPAIPAHRLLSWMKNGHLRRSEESRQAWDEHGRTDRYLTPGQVRGTCARALPGAKVTAHLFWRYSIVWKKPGAG